MAVQLRELSAGETQQELEHGAVGEMRAGDLAETERANFSTCGASAHSAHATEQGSGRGPNERCVSVLRCLGHLRKRRVEPVQGALFRREERKKDTFLLPRKL